MWFCVQVTAAIASVEDTLGVPSPQQLAEQGAEGSQLDSEVCRLAEGECSPAHVAGHVVTCLRHNTHHRNQRA